MLGKKHRDDINFLSHRLQRVDYCKAIMKNKMAILTRLNIAIMLMVTMMKLTSQYLLYHDSAAPLKWDTGHDKR